MGGAIDHGGPAAGRDDDHADGDRAGSDQIPRITDAEAARRSPELAVLSALAHGGEPEGEAIALAALEATRDLDNTREIFYAGSAWRRGLGP